MHFPPHSSPRKGKHKWHAKSLFNTPPQELQPVLVAVSDTLVLEMLEGMETCREETHTSRDSAGRGLRRLWPRWHWPRWLWHRRRWRSRHWRRRPWLRLRFRRLHRFHPGTAQREAFWSTRSKAHALEELAQVRLHLSSRIRAEIGCSPYLCAPCLKLAHRNLQCGKKRHSTRKLC